MAIVARVTNRFNCDSDKELSTELADFDYGGIVIDCE